MVTNTIQKRNIEQFAKIERVRNARKHYCPNTKIECEIVTTYGKPNAIKKFIGKLGKPSKPRGRKGWIELRK